VNQALSVRVTLSTIRGGFRADGTAVRSVLERDPSPCQVALCGPGSGCGGQISWLAVPGLNEPEGPRPSRSLCNLDARSSTPGRKVPWVLSPGPDR
jgi:hypothetical protein